MNYQLRNLRFKYENLNFIFLSPHFSRAVLPSPPPLPLVLFSSSPVAAVPRAQIGDAAATRLRRRGVSRGHRRQPCGPGLVPRPPPPAPQPAASLATPLPALRLLQPAATPQSSLVRPDAAACPSAACLRCRHQLLPPQLPVVPEKER